MDYRELLKKYIMHICDSEGIDYLEHHMAYDGNIITPDELVELKKLSAEVEDEERRK